MPKEHSWDEAAEGWADFVRTGKDYCRDYLNNPAAFELIGEVNGKKVLDLACGEGYNTRLLASKGAQVIGVDATRSLLLRAEEEETRKPLGIKYYLRDASCLEGISSSAFDVVTCFMALMDIKNYQEAIAEAARVLKSGGRFIFSITHPCFERMTVDGATLEASERYFGEVKGTVEWKMERLTKKFVTTAYHRTLTDYSVALARQNLLISRIVEPQATSEMVKDYPALKNCLNKPLFIIFETVKAP